MHKVIMNHHVKTPSNFWVKMTIDKHSDESEDKVTHCRHRLVPALFLRTWFGLWFLRHSCLHAQRHANNVKDGNITEDCPAVALAYLTVDTLSASLPLLSILVTLSLSLPVPPSVPLSLSVGIFLSHPVPLFVLFPVSVSVLVLIPVSIPLFSPPFVLVFLPVPLPVPVTALLLVSLLLTTAMLLAGPLLVPAVLLLRIPPPALVFFVLLRVPEVAFTAVLWNLLRLLEEFALRRIKVIYWTQQQHLRMSIN